MVKKIQIITVAFLAFTSGLCTAAKSQPQMALSTPKQNRKILRAGKASWYSKKSPGINKHTANNEIFDDRALTCAMWDAPFNQQIKVTNRANGKSVVVRVNDRGPHKRYVRKGRVVDLTRQAFRKIGALQEGLIDVEIEFL